MINLAQSRQWYRLLKGIFLILLGATLIFEPQMLDQLWKFWPLIIMIPSLESFVNDRGSRINSAALFIAFGVVLAKNFKIIQIGSLWQFWPAIFILWGAKVLFEGKK